MKKLKKERTVIPAEHIVDSTADALQYMSYYHPVDFIAAMEQARQTEQSPFARRAIEQILINSRMCAMGQRPICQDTGIVVIFARIGQHVTLDSDVSLEALLNEGVRRAYTHPDNPLRASMVSPPFGARKNTGDNTPAVLHVEYDNSAELEVHIAAKGGGSENKARFGVLNPSESISDWVVEQVRQMGAGWCPPGILGIGIGGSPEKSMLMAKRALMNPITSLQRSDPNDPVDALRVEIANRVNQLGIGAQGLGGLVTVLDVKIIHYPTHAASLPVSVIPNCAATRHVNFTLRGDKPASFEPPKLSIWPKIDWAPSSMGKRVDLNTVSIEDTRQWEAGQTLLLNGSLLTGRDAAHKRLVERFNQGLELPEGLNLTGRMLYYVGPVDAVGDEVIGPAGPTTATRMDPYMDTMLKHTGLLGVIGKAERGPVGLAALRKYQTCYLIAVGGAAYLISKAIRQSKVVAFHDLGMEAIYEFTVEDMPVIVAVDSQGNAIHEQGPAQWKGKAQAVELPRPI